MSWELDKKLKLLNFNTFALSVRSRYPADVSILLTRATPENWWDSWNSCFSTLFRQNWLENCRLRDHHSENNVFLFAEKEVDTKCPVSGELNQWNCFPPSFIPFACLHTASNNYFDHSERMSNYRYLCLQGFNVESSKCHTLNINVRCEWTSAVSTHNISHNQKLRRLWLQSW